LNNSDLKRNVPDDRVGEFLHVLEGREAVLVDAVDEIGDKKVLAVRTEYRIASEWRDECAMTIEQLNPYMRVVNSFIHLTDQGSME
jgi:hypothetical protein